MRTRLVAVLLCAVAVSACTSIRVTGFVTDEISGENIATCGAEFGPFYASCNAEGKFVIKGRKSWKKLKVIAAGYEPKTVTVDSSRTRYPAISIQMLPKGSSTAVSEAHP